MRSGGGDRFPGGWESTMPGSSEFKIQHVDLNGQVYILV